MERRQHRLHRDLHALLTPLLRRGPSLRASSCDGRLPVQTGPPDSPGRPPFNQPLYTMSNILDLQRLAIDTDEDAGWSTVSVNCNNTKAEEIGQ